MRSLLSLRALSVLATLAVPAMALAKRKWGGALSAPEFDATAAGTVALLVVGGVFLIARKRRKQQS